MKQINLVSAILMLFLFTACGDDDGDDVVNTVISFTDTSAIVDEDVGTVTILIEFSSPLIGAGEISYSLTGSANINGDYTVESSSPLVVAEGDESTSISFTIIDDEIIENFDVVEDDNDDLVLVETSERTVIVELTSVTGNLQLPNEGERIFTYNIIDNDQRPDSGMKWDLAWEVEGSMDVDAVNLDMIAIYDVVIDENNTITEAKTYTISDKESGYESLIVDDAAPDSDYYVVIEYVDGSGDANFVFATYHSTDPIIFADLFTEETADEGLVIVAEISSKRGGNFSRKNARYQSVNSILKVKKGILD